jgi:hypothetical protein
VYKLAIISLVFKPAFSDKVRGTTSKASPNLLIEYWSNPEQVLAYSLIWLDKYLNN